MNDSAPRSEPEATPTAARRAAQRLLCRAEREGRPVADVLADYAARTAKPRPEPFGYTVRLVEGVAAHRARLSDLISLYAAQLGRGPVPDGVGELMRIAVYELLYVPRCDDAALFHAAAELASPENARFVEELLIHIASNAQR